MHHDTSKQENSCVPGGFQGSIEDTAWCVTADTNPQPDLVYTCNTEETDTDCGYM